jgi:hypothetical protein
MSSANSQPKSFCNSCQRDTNHAILQSHACEDRRGSPEHPQIVIQKWSILKCCGCDSVKANLLEVSDGFTHPRETQLPPVEMRKLPDWKGKLPAHVQVSGKLPR